MLEETRQPAKRTKMKRAIPPSKQPVEAFVYSDEPAKKPYSTSSSTKHLARFQSRAKLNFLS
jgi:hypothetical protein